MTTLDDILNDLAPEHRWSESWSDVLRRAGEPAPRRRIPQQHRSWRIPRGRLLLAVVALAVVAVPLVAVAASNDWWFLKHGNPLSEPATAPIVVREGEWNGKGWDLVAYPSAQGGLCWGITPAATLETGRGGAIGCGSIVGFADGRNPAMSITFLSADAGPELPAYVAGPVISTAARVVIRFANTTVTTDTFPAPKELGNVRFYAVLAPTVTAARPLPNRHGFSSPIVWLAGYDANGKIVACLNPATANDGISLLSACR